MLILSPTETWGNCVALKETAKKRHTNTHTRTQLYRVCSSKNLKTKLLIFSTYVVSFWGTKLCLNISYKGGEHRVGIVNWGRPNPFHSSGSPKSPSGPGTTTPCSSLGRSTSRLPSSLRSFQPSLPPRSSRSVLLAENLLLWKITPKPTHSRAALVPLLGSDRSLEACICTDLGI